MHIRSIPLVLGILLTLACGQPAQQAAPTSAPATAPATPAAAPAATKPALAATSAAAPSGTSAPAAPALSITAGVPDESKTLNGAGATFPAPLYQKWFEEYAKLT